MYGTERTFDPDPLRTRCPGPVLLADVAREGPLASGSIPLRALGRRRPVLRLTARGAYASEAYAGRTTGELRFALRRLRIVRRTGATPLS